MSMLETGRMEWIYVHKYRGMIASFAIRAFFHGTVNLCLLSTKVIYQDLCL